MVCNLIILIIIIMFIVSSSFSRINNFLTNAILCHAARRACPELVEGHTSCEPSFSVIANLAKQGDWEPYPQGKQSQTLTKTLPSRVGFALASYEPQAKRLTLWCHCEPCKAG